MSGLKDARNIVLEAVTAAVFVFEGKMMKDKPLHLALHFEGGISFSLHADSDGESLRVDHAALVPVDMEESGEIVIVDFSRSLPWKSAVGRSLVQATEVQSAGYTIGLELGFDGGTAAYVFNWGDDIWVVDAWPEEIMSHEADIRRIPLFSQS